MPQHGALNNNARAARRTPDPALAPSGTALPPEGSLGV